jgi:hypothetical protein
LAPLSAGDSIRVTQYIAVRMALRVSRTGELLPARSRDAGSEEWRLPPHPTSEILVADKATGNFDSEGSAVVLGLMF